MESPMPVTIIDIDELEGRTIVKASIWSDGSSMSLVLDNGGILQVCPLNDDQLHFDIEFATEESPK
jgi:hypothetical protein